jgi:hypothetical protein
LTDKLEKLKSKYNRSLLIEIAKKRSEELNNECLRKQKLIKKGELKDYSDFVKEYSKMKAE